MKIIALKICVFKAFVNLGSAARGPRENKEEEKFESKPAAVKPTFRGKLNLKDTGAQNTDQGNSTAANTSYGFSVTYKQERKEGDQKEGDD